MISLANEQLEVAVLDPIADQIRLGSRYCTGGYVYSVVDRRRGVITSGPGYPDEEYPPVFDGQGLPEAFPSPLWPGMGVGSPAAGPAPGTTILVIGVGLVEATENVREMPVKEFCRWTTEQTPTTLRMETRQEFGGWSLALVRELALINRTLRSATRLINHGTAPIPFRWFPHPFFPNPWGECCKLNVAVSFPDNPGYSLLENGFIETRRDQPWDRKGYYQVLEHRATERLVVLQRHPVLGLIAATCSYVPTFFPIWGNRNCFSFEPYLEDTVAPGSAMEWSITYDF